MSKSRHTEAQMIGALKQVEAGPALPLLDFFHHRLGDVGNQRRGDLTTSMLWVSNQVEFGLMGRL